MPRQTLRNIIGLSHNDIIIFQELPSDINGMYDLENRSNEFNKFKNSLSVSKIAEGLYQINGRGIYICNNIELAIQYIKWNIRESITDLGLKYIKRGDGKSLFYFISNNTANNIDEQVDLSTHATSIVLINPLNGEEGNVVFKTKPNAEPGAIFRLQLKSGQSIIVKTDYHYPDTAKKTWKYIEPLGSAINLENNVWKLKFTEGGPILPKGKIMTKIQPWTNFTNDSTTQFFSGTAVYTTSFTLKNKSADYLLQLDKLYESARIIINGKDAGVIWSLPFETKVGKYLKEGKNTVSIEVCNLMANRIRNMDRNGVVWRNYHEINFVNINYKNFDASNWKVQPSGIDGAVKLIPLK